MGDHVPVRMAAESLYAWPVEARDPARAAGFACVDIRADTDPRNDHVENNTDLTVPQSD